MLISKLEAAIRQADAAIVLFLQGDYLSSLTLAGAADDMLGSLMRQAGKASALDRIVIYHRPDTDPSLTAEEHRTLVASIANRARNQSKHAGDPKETHVDVDQIHPLQMLMRAVPMVPNLGAGLTPKMVELFEWVGAHPEAVE